MSEYLIDILNVNTLVQIIIVKTPDHLIFRTIHSFLCWCFKCILW